MIVEPIRQYRFRLAACDKLIRNQVQDVTFDNKNYRATVKVRATVDPEQMEACLNFARYNNWHLEIMSVSGHTSLYGLNLNEMKLEEHTFTFDYAVSEPVLHTYVFSYSCLSIIYPNVVGVSDTPVEDTSTDEFPSIAKAMAKLEAENKVTSEDKTAKDL